MDSDEDGQMIQLREIRKDSSGSIVQGAVSGLRFRSSVRDKRGYSLRENRSSKLSGSIVENSDGKTPRWREATNVKVKPKG